MILSLQQTYLLTFHSSFTALDGIYTIVGAYSYNKIVAEDIDIRETLTVVNITDPEAIEQFVADHRHEVFYEIKFANGTTLSHVPESLIVAGDPDVAEYYNTSVSIDLGSFKHPEVAHAIGKILTDGVKMVLGNVPIVDPVDGGPVTSDPEAKVSVYSKIWLSNSQYKEMAAEREASKLPNPGMAESGIADYYAAYVETNRQLQQQVAYTAALEEIIRNIPKS